MPARRTAPLPTPPSPLVELAESIDPSSTRLFLYNVSTKTFLGPFRAAEAPARNIVREAWGMRKGGSCFPMQVRVYAESRDDSIFSLAESEVDGTLEFYARGKFSQRMSGENATRLGERLLKNGRKVAR